MNDLECRYRRLLKVFPPSYRDRMGDDLVATLLAGHQTNQRRPAAREVWALIRAGLAMRLARGDDQDRLRAWRVVGVVSVALIVSTATLVIGINVSGRWADPLPLPLMPMWVLLVIVSCAPLASPRARRLGPVLVPMWIIAFAVASRWLLAPRSLVVALALSSLLVSAARPARAWITVASCAVGAALGAVAARHVVERLSNVAGSRPRGVMYVGFVFEWPSGGFEYICITALAVVLAIGVIRPWVALASSLCVIPVMLVIQVTTDRYQTYDNDLSAGFGIALATAVFVVSAVATAAVRGNSPRRSQEAPHGSPMSPAR